MNSGTKLMHKKLFKNVHFTMAILKCYTVIYYYLLQIISTFYISDTMNVYAYILKDIIVYLVAEFIA